MEDEKKEIPEDRIETVRIPIKKVPPLIPPPRIIEGHRVVPRRRLPTNTIQDKIKARFENAWMKKAHRTIVRADVYWEARNKQWQTIQKEPFFVWLAIRVMLVVCIIITVLAIAIATILCLG